MDCRALPLFRQIEPSFSLIQTDIREDADPKSIEHIAKLAETTQYDVHLRVDDLSPSRLRMLNMFEGARLIELEIDFDKGSWLYEELESDNSADPKAQKLAGLKFDFDIDLLQLELITLKLDSELSQEEQLRPFIGLSPSRGIYVYKVSTKGAEFILNSPTSWPKRLKFGFLDDVSDELRKKLEAKFCRADLETFQ